MSYNLSELCEIRVILTPAATQTHMAFIVLVPVLVFAMLAHFNVRKRISILTKRRSRLLVTIVAAGIMTSYVSILIMELSPYACWLRTLLDAITIPLLITPLILRLTQYQAAQTLRMRSKIMRSSSLRAPHLSNLSQLGKVIGFQDGEESIAEESATTAPSNAYRRVLSLCRVDSSRTTMEFIVKPEFVLFWLIIVMIPYLVFFGIHLTLDPKVTLCTYCTMDVDEVIFYMVSSVVLVCVGLYIAAPLYKKQSDPLGLLKEFLLVWIIGGSIAVLSFLLQAINPQQLNYPRGEVVWRWLFLICGLFVLFFQTTYQFIEVRRWRNRTLVLGSSLTPEELLEEIYRDPTLHSLLLAHMQAELNGESLTFLEEVDMWKTLKEGKQRTARAIFDTYLHRGAPFEVNISSQNAEAVMLQCEKGNVSDDVFALCVKEIKALIVVDVLPRFLESRFYKQYRAGHPANLRMGGSALTASLRLNSSVS